VECRESFFADFAQNREIKYVWIFTAILFQSFDEKSKMKDAILAPCA